MTGSGRSVSSGGENGGLGAVAPNDTAFRISAHEAAG